VEKVGERLLRLGETCKLPFVVFNSLRHETVNVSVVAIFNTDNVAFIELKATDDKCYERVVEENSTVMNFQLPFNRKQQHHFIIKPLRIGVVRFRLVALSSVGYSIVDGSLLVLPELLIINTRKELLINLPGDNNFNYTSELMLPSTKTEMTKIGATIVVDLMEETSEKYEASNSSNERFPNEVYLTAAVVIDLLKSSKDSPEIDQSFKYLDENLQDIQDLPTNAIVAYAFALKKHETAKALIAFFNDIAIVNDDLMFWQCDESKICDVEVASYLLMTQIEVGDLARAIPIRRWLRRKSNSFVIARQALQKFSDSMKARQTNMNITIGDKILHVDQSNFAEIVCPLSTTELQVTATGKGFALLVVDYNYLHGIYSTSKAFTIKVEVKSSISQQKEVAICVSYSQMSDVNAVMEVHLSGGYVYSEKSIDRLLEDNIRKVQTQQQKSIIIFPVQVKSGKAFCTQITANLIEANKIEERKAFVRVYDPQSFGKL